jgi:hypothetical protein
MVCNGCTFGDVILIDDDAGEYEALKSRRAQFRIAP